MTATRIQRTPIGRRRGSMSVITALVSCIVLIVPAAVSASAGPTHARETAVGPGAKALTAVGGRAAAARHVRPADMVRHGEQPLPPGVAVPIPQRGAPVPAARAAIRPAAIGTLAVTPTTTTLTATPNPLVYPAQVHLTSTTTPAPQSDAGFIPGIGIYVDGIFRASSTIDSTTGVSVVDLSLLPGTYSITAQFGGNSTFGASSSAPVIEVVVQQPPLGSVAGTAALQSAAGFPGVAGGPSAPFANPSVGVGPRDIVQMSESGVGFFERTGAPLFTMSLTDFFTIEPGGQDLVERSPQVVFDALHGRWVAIEVSRGGTTGHLYIATSDTDSFLDGWWIYRFDVANTALTNAAVGVTSDKIALGYDATTITTDQPLGASVLVVNYADVMARVDTLAFSRSGYSLSYAGWRPAQNLSAGNAVRAVGWKSTFQLAYLEATGTVTAPGAGVAFSVVDITAVPGTNTSGPYIGPTSAIWKAGKLVFVSTHDCLPDGDPFTESCVRVTSLTTGPIAVEQDFAIGLNGHALWRGGIGIAGDDSLMIAYSDALSGPSPSPVGISTYATVQLAGDAANSYHPPQLLSEGTPWCPGGPSCVGGPGGSARALYLAADPVDTHAVWQGGLNTVSGGWATWISKLRPATTAPDGSVTLAGGRPVTNSLRLGIAATPAATATATQMLVSNASTTADGKLSSSRAVPVASRLPWSLADASLGGSSATGVRTVYIQWGNGAGAWSAVEPASIEVGTPLGTDLVPLNPARLLDSRSGNGLSEPFHHLVPRTFQVTGRGGVPANAVAVTGNLTVARQTSGGYLFLGPTATSTPSSSTLNFPKGDIRANGVTVKLSATGRLGLVFVGSGSSQTADALFDVTGYLLADDPTHPTGGTFVAIAPTRFLDTRAPLGLAGRFTSRVPRTFCITGCGPVPGDATAVTGNLTVTGQTSAGFLFLGPTRTSSPSSSTLNFPTGDVRANNVTVRLDADGNLSAVFMGATSSASTHVVFDITGYFVKGPWGATFVPLDPARILDTRNGTGLPGPFPNATPRAFATAGHGGVPATDSVAVTGNLTVVNQTAGGFAFIGPTASATPSSSTLNIPLGDVRANGVDVGLGSDGTLSAVWVTAPASTAAMIFDVGGYFR